MRINYTNKQHVEIKTNKTHTKKKKEKTTWGYNGLRIIISRCGANKWGNQIIKKKHDGGHRLWLQLKQFGILHT